MKDLIVIQKQYKNKKGEIKTDNQFYIELENGRRIRIMPYVFDREGYDKWSTFSDLMLVARVVNDEK